MVYYFVIIADFARDSLKSIYEEEIAEYKKLLL